MTTRLLGGPRTLSSVWDENGYRTYKVKHRVECLENEDGDIVDGPANVMQTPGLPVPGAIWQFLEEDIDVYVWCRRDMTVTPVLGEDDGPCAFYDVEQTFSNKSTSTSSPGGSSGSASRCHEVRIEDPLLEPAQVDGNFVKFQEEATNDRFGLPILTSSWEVIRGPQVEFDKNRKTVKIVQNVASLFQADTLPTQMMDSVNATPIWGYAARCVKLSGGGFSPKYWGQCYKYYTRTLEFEINYLGFDRDLLDEGTKALHGENRNGTWTTTAVDSSGTMPNPANPLHFVRYKDQNGENARVVLNGAGLPIEAEPGTGTGPGGPGMIHVERYDEDNFLLLGVPITF